MATHAYDDLYSYLAAFKNSSLAEIIAYLEELGQRRFDAFIRGLAPLIPIEKIENQSLFNFSVDSTLEGGKFPCTDYACREQNIYHLAKFSALYADKTLIHCPIESAFEMGHDDYVSVDELAFGIYLTMRVEDIVKAGILGFSSNYIPLCKDCLARQIERESKAKGLISSYWDELVRQFCSSTSCTLKQAPDGNLYVAIEGMDAYGSHDEMDVDFLVIPSEYESLYASQGETRLDRDMLEKGGILTILLPLLDDCFQALVNPYFSNSSYLTTRPAQIEFLESVTSTLYPRKDQTIPIRRLSCPLPIAENATLRSILDCRIRNEESFLVFRDTLSKGLSERPIDTSTLADLKNDLIEPELHKISLVMKNERSRLVTSAGIEAAIGIASFTLGQYGIASPSDAMAFLGAAGIGAVASQSADFLREAKAKENPMYFLWKLNRNNRL